MKGCRGLKHLEGGIRAGPAALTAAAMVASLALLALALRTIPLGTAYAIWTGIGVIGTVTVGVLAHGEPLGVLRLLSLTMILVGIAGVKLASA
jgi:quaternary ammonium compound-resistance protein SugE